MNRATHQINKRGHHDILIWVEIICLTLILTLPRRKMVHYNVQNRNRALRCGFCFFKSLYWDTRVFCSKMCVSVLCENQTRVLDLRSMCVCVCVCLGNMANLAKRMAENWILDLWKINQVNTIEGKQGFICSTCMVKQKCSSALPLSVSKISPSIFPWIGNQEQSNVDRFACNLVEQEKSPDFLVFWSEGFACTIFA